MAFQFNSAFNATPPATLSETPLATSSINAKRDPRRRLDGSRRKHESRSSTVATMTMEQQTLMRQLGALLSGITSHTTSHEAVPSWSPTPLAEASPAKGKKGVKWADTSTGELERVHFIENYLKQKQPSRQYGETNDGPHAPLSESTRKYVFVTSQAQLENNPIRERRCIRAAKSASARALSWREMKRHLFSLRREVHDHDDEEEEYGALFSSVESDGKPLCVGELVRHRSRGVGEVFGRGAEGVKVEFLSGEKKYYDQRGEARLERVSHGEMSVDPEVEIGVVEQNDTTTHGRKRGRHNDDCEDELTMPKKQRLPREVLAARVQAS